MAEALVTAKRWTPWLSALASLAVCGCGPHVYLITEPQGAPSQAPSEAVDKQSPCGFRLCVMDVKRTGFSGSVQDAICDLIRQSLPVPWLATTLNPSLCDIGITLDNSMTGTAGNLYSAYSNDFLGHFSAPSAGLLGKLICYAARPGTGIAAKLAAERAAVSRPPAPQPAPQAEPARARARLVSDVDSPSYRSAERPDDFAVVIGIEKYSELPDAQFAERDAEAVKAHLLALGLPERNIAYLANSKAAKSSLEKYVEQWLPRLVKDDSRVFFYFSGHGAPDVKSGAAYLVPWDGDANFLDTTGYPAKRLYEKLAALKAKEIIVAMDACFSGAGGRSVLPAGARPLVTKTEQFTAAAKVVSLTASAGEEISGTEAEQGHGTFTYYLLKGLNGAAKDQSLQSLFDYLKPQVQDSARRLNRDQTPQIRGGLTSLRLR